ncbi:hypothetical protein HYN59_16700 [Flavobacterium album]|uniref:Uncharacterized protein n=1 Tax=Flavobacterium album TaxID=2175091 RepID=A0A2S1R1X9_9FLAO|nr:hypothetical protein [Flavobacterium album]AWH86644.1 hypothetical protein HYN59_16700 [Flavobacterium album]
MTKEYFTEAVYKYFPRGINEISHLQDYMASTEFIALSNKCHEEELRKKNGDFDRFYKEIESLDTLKNFYDFTLFHQNDRAHNLQLGELIGTKHYSICLYVSIIIPYYVIYVLETDVSHALAEPVDFLRPGYKEPKRSHEMEMYYKPLMDQMGDVAKKYFHAQQFPEELVHTIIPDISYQAIPFGEFTFFNAFFHESYYYFRL